MLEALQHASSQKCCQLTRHHPAGCASSTITRANWLVLAGDMRWQALGHYVPQQAQPQPTLLVSQPQMQPQPQPHMQQLHATLQPSSGGPMFPPVTLPMQQGCNRTITPQHGFQQGFPQPGPSADPGANHGSAWSQGSAGSMAAAAASDATPTPDGSVHGGSSFLQPPAVQGIPPGLMQAAQQQLASLQPQVRRPARHAWAAPAFVCLRVIRAFACPTSCCSSNVDTQRV